MGRFGEIIDSLGVGEAGAVMYPDTFVDDIRGAYDFDMQGSSAVISQLQAELETVKAQNVELAAANWNLLQSIPTNTEVVDTPEEEPEDNPEDTDPDDWYE